MSGSVGKVTGAVFEKSETGAIGVIIWEVFVALESEEDLPREPGREEEVLFSSGIV